MILYFSATGNCKYVASRLAEMLNDEAVDILSIVKYPLESKDIIRLTPTNNILGIVTPTYACGVPKAVEDILSLIKITDSVYSFVVSTFGTTPGCSGVIVEESLKRNNSFNFDAFFSVKMPDTYTPFFDLSDKSKVFEQNELAEKQILQIGSMLKNRKSGDFSMKKMPEIFKYLYRPAYELIRSTSLFRLKENCIGCGKCVENCPEKAIIMENGKPTWRKSKCQMCLRCLHNCPNFSIQILSLTKNHGQYTNPKA